MAIVCGNCTELFRRPMRHATLTDVQICFDQKFYAEEQDDGLLAEERVFARMMEKNYLEDEL